MVCAGRIVAWSAIMILVSPVGLAAADGVGTFQQRCVACHTIGRGVKVGPDLKDVTQRREREWLRRFISVPDQMIAFKDPIAIDLLKKHNNVQMPNLGLTADEVEALITFLENPPPGSDLPAQAPLPPGSIVYGKDLFTGAMPLENGGSACMACHSVSGIGRLGGGAMGPDLTAAYSKFGPSGLASILATIPFPTMRPIFTERPLTLEEQANLFAFLRYTVPQRSGGMIGQLTVLAVAGALVLLGLSHILWSKRVSGVRRSVVKRG